MKFNTAMVALVAGLAAAAPAPKNDEHAVLEKRIDPITAGIISGAVVTAIVGTASGVAVGSINNILPNLSTWEQVREQFTKKTVAEMWARRPNNRVAAICYVSNPLLSDPSTQLTICRTWATPFPSRSRSLSWRLSRSLPACSTLTTTASSCKG